MTDAFRVLADFAAAPYDPSYGGGVDVLGGTPSGSGSHHSGSSSSSHSSSHESGEHHALFGSFTYLKADKWSYSLLIVVGSILLIEAFFHVVHLSTRDSPFHKVISAIEKELMIVGITAFMFKIVLNSIVNLDPNWYFALEIADLIVPLFSFTNCFLSFLLIFRSVLICDIWSKAYHLKAAELLDEYLANSFYLEVRRWFPIASKLIAEIEFQMMHDIFCEHYSVQRKAFAFDEYASLIYERFVHEIIELRTEHWAVFIALLMFVWLPHKTMTGLAGCHDNPGAHHCSHEGSILLLIIFGCGLLLISGIFVIASRYYQVAIIHKSGVTCIDDYPTFLQSADEGIENVVERKRLGEAELKAVIKAALHETELKRRHDHHSLRHVRFLIVGCFEYLQEFFASKHRRSVAPSDSVFSEDELKKMINSSFEEALASQTIKKSPKKNAASEQQATTAAAPCALTDGPNAKGGGSPVVSPETSPLKGLKHKPRVTSLKHSSAGKLTDIFWLGRPVLYFEGVQLLLLPISLYFAVWFLEFDVYDVDPILKFISFMVGVGSVFCFMYVVKSAALLKAIYHVDKDAMLEVIEQTEGSRQLGETIRGKLLETLANIDGDAYSTLRRLFDEIDKNHSNKLSRVEFEVLMDRLEVNFSRKKWKQIYHEIDRNYDDEISFDEFFMFLFPQHDFATANELKRMKLVRHRVAQRSQKIRKSLPSKRNLNDDGLDEDDFMNLVGDEDLEAPPVYAEAAVHPLPSSSSSVVVANEEGVLGSEEKNNLSSVDNGASV